MKKIIFTISFLSLVFHSIGQTKLIPNNYTILGHITSWENRYIYFSFKGIGKDRIWDSAIVKNNSFKFKGKLIEPSNGFITTLKFGRVQNLNDSNITKRLFISSSNMTIKLSPNNFQKAKLFGSKFQGDYYKLEKSKERLYNQITPLSNFYDSLNDKYITVMKSNNDSFTLKKLERKLDSLREKLDIFGTKLAKIDKAFFKQNPNSYVTSYLLKDYYNNLNLKELTTYYNAMWPSNKILEYGIKLKETINKLTKGSPGGMASNFSAIDSNGDAISLSQFKGNYILLDFWASWCKPCRAGNLELIKLYNKYKNKGIEFIGIADDNGSEDKWKSAILKDDISIWRHILDKKIGDNYSVHSIPLQILIDKNGKIIGRFGAGGEPNENLSKKMEEVFGQ